MFCSIGQEVLASVDKEWFQSLKWISENGGEDYHEWLNHDRFISDIWAKRPSGELSDPAKKLFPNYRE
jgi:hypothetical protein